MLLKVNRQAIVGANLGGRGGKEKQLKKLFENDLTIINAPLYDAEDERGHKYEFKKQKDLQWFDIGKYHDLSPSDKEINMVFVVYKTEVTFIAVIKLGCFIDRMTTTAKYHPLGWTKENIKEMYNRKKLYPSFQTKAKLKVREFVTENKDIVGFLYKK